MGVSSNFLRGLGSTSSCIFLCKDLVYIRKPPNARNTGVKPFIYFPHCRNKLLGHFHRKREIRLQRKMGQGVNSAIFTS